MIVAATAPADVLATSLVLIGLAALRIEPSPLIRPGIFVHVNDHFDASEEALETDPDHLLLHLTEGWSSSVRRFERIIAAVKEFAR